MYTCSAHIAHLDILTFLHENGCPWDKGTADIACFAVSLECLQYAYENDCRPIDEVTAEFAATGNTSNTEAYSQQYIEVLQKCLPPNVEATKSKRLKYLEYLVENECPGAQQYTHLLDKEQ